MAKLVTGTFEYTLEEALRVVRNAPSRTHFQLMVDAWLPTGDGQGFVGRACVGVPRKDMLKAMQDMGRVLCTSRGAKMRLHVTAPEHDGGLGFIACY